MRGQGSSVGVEVVHDGEGVLDDEPLDRIAQVCLQHGLAVRDLLSLCIIVVLNFQLVHVIL